MFKALAFILLLPLAGCSVNVDHYKNTTPAFALESFFSGNLVAYGMIQGPRDEVTRRFKVDMVGRWQGNKGVLEEDFVYDDGEKQRRVWHLEKLAPQRYVGTASDVIGNAMGQIEGYALNWHYSLEVPIDGEIWTFQLNDWMYLLDDNRLLNKATMTKFGVPVAEITLWIEKRP